MKKRIKKTKLVTVGEAYFERETRDARFKQLEYEGAQGLTKSWQTEYNPATRRLAMVFIVEYQEEPDLAENLPEQRVETVN